MFPFELTVHRPEIGNFLFLLIPFLPLPPVGYFVLTVVTETKNPREINSRRKVDGTKCWRIGSRPGPTGVTKSLSEVTTTINGEVTGRRTLGRQKSEEETYGQRMDGTILSFGGWDRHLLERLERQTPDLPRRTLRQERERGD